MKFVVVILTIVHLNVLADQCNPRFHFWRPFNGSIPNDALLAGVDDDGRKNYVAKIIPLDQYLWTIPGQLKEGDNYVNFRWHEEKNNFTKTRVDEFIEILCVDDPDNVYWERVNKFASELVPRCCLVQAGIALYKNHTYRTFIGKAERKGLNYIGRVYLENYWPGISIIDGTNSTKILNDYDVLSYDCKIFI